ncbi:hypothetical protein CDAR_100071 [Caerostris darwini]|uniref:Uncharacterized protein n=1 Tax=Caerostris darwini TaxID=1538125 RepID=A0AAV4UT33_9ARAC|nr:hypothetical protein CDAR_100071 [Caerostris darwini]
MTTTPPSSLGTERQPPPSWNVDKQFFLHFHLYLSRMNGRSYRDFHPLVFGVGSTSQGVLTEERSFDGDAAVYRETLGLKSLLGNACGLLVTIFEFPDMTRLLKPLRSEKVFGYYIKG